jgi:hypothetical protein
LKGAKGQDGNELSTSLEGGKEWGHGNEPSNSLEKWGDGKELSTSLEGEKGNGNGNEGGGQFDELCS